MFPSRQKPPADLRGKLRLATRDAHLRLEAKVDFDRRMTSLDAYRSLLEDFLRFLRPTEEALAALDLEKFGIDFRFGQRTGWLEADLKDLGHSADSLNSLPGVLPVPKLSDPLEALGVLYVWEGSNLGRQVMLGKLTPLLHISPDWAGRFFNGYGKKTGVMWRSFVNALNEAGSDPHAARVIEASALATFAAFEIGLGSTSQA